MQLFNTLPTPNCSCSAVYTSLECPTHGEKMKRSLERDDIWRITLAREHYEQKVDADTLAVETLEHEATRR